ncbi:hypothetical protein [Nonomuraea typhae]|uniref:hypothetical protein n=1 Tax=Nonomuraea typhae TaxID=2603600 RepID=UPI0012F99D95|nr:hypothetical protein [Nonomuraea typhae]
MTESADRSQRTITQAIDTFTTFDFGSWVFESLRIAAGKTRTDGGSGVQSFLEGLEFRIGDKWYGGHVTLSPVKSESDSFYFDSAHLTITGGPYKGNWFFQINETQAVPSAPPKNYTGQYSRNGNNLPSPLKEEIVKLLEIIGIFDSD